MKNENKNRVKDNIKLVEDLIMTEMPEIQKAIMQKLKTNAKTSEMKELLADLIGYDNIVIGADKDFMVAKMYSMVYGNAVSIQIKASSISFEFEFCLKK